MQLINLLIELIAIEKLRETKQKSIDNEYFVEVRMVKVKLLPTTRWNNQMEQLDSIGIS